METTLRPTLLTKGYTPSSVMAQCFFGKEHDSFASSLKEFTFYMVGATVGMVVASVK